MNKGEREKYMEISVILAYYNNLGNLELMLEAFEKQTFRDFEVIVAEDDHNPETEAFLNISRSLFHFPIVHVNQDEKIGFRKTTMLNKAIRKSRGKTLVFIDGDCIPHKNYLKQHQKHSMRGAYNYGRRVLVGEKFTRQLKRKKSFSSLHFFSLLFSDSSLIKEGIYWPCFGLHAKNRKLSGCNWGIQREDILSVNGFDEDYVRPGVGEDFDVEWRLKSAGFRKRSIRNKANVYHLYHPKNSTSEDGKFNEALMEKKMEANHVRCLNGLMPLNE
jgi:glycosyltransferase involved in cell wall biosynthesis